ncbi:unnamed protein product [Chrysoparadoxa australica]
MEACLKALLHGEEENREETLKHAVARAYQAVSDLAIKADGCDDRVTWSAAVIWICFFHFEQPPSMEAVLQAAIQHCTTPGGAAGPPPTISQLVDHISLVHGRVGLGSKDQAARLERALQEIKEGVAVCNLLHGKSLQLWETIRGGAGNPRGTEPLDWAGAYEMAWYLHLMCCTSQGLRVCHADFARRIIVLLGCLTFVMEAIDAGWELQGGTTSINPGSSQPLAPWAERISTAAKCPVADITEASAAAEGMANALLSAGHLLTWGQQTQGLPGLSSPAVNATEAGQDAGVSASSSAPSGLLHPAVLRKNRAAIQLIYEARMPKGVAELNQGFVLSDREQAGIQLAANATSQTLPLTREALAAPAAAASTPQRLPQPNPFHGSPAPGGGIYSSGIAYTPSSKVTQKAYATPFSAAFEVVNWMAALEQLPEEAAPGLIAIFKQCNPNPMERIRERADKLFGIAREQAPEEFSARSSQSLLKDFEAANANPTPTANAAAAGAGAASAAASTSTAGSGTTQAASTSDSNAPGAAAAEDDDVESKTEVSGRAKALYYRTLFSILERETQRLQQVDHGKFLEQEAFHSALIACCLEAVAKAKSLLPLSFPWALETFRIEPLDMLRVMESFVKCCPSLPSNLKRHLQEVQESLLDQYFWRAGSAVFTMIAEQSAEGPWPLPGLDIPVSASRHNEKSTDSSSQTLATPTNAAKGSSSSSNSNSNSNSTAASAAGAACLARVRTLSLCYRKLYELAAERVAELCLKMLGLRTEVADQVWAVVKHCLVNHTTMLRDRHLDHLVLCSTYSICKVYAASLPHQEMTFRRIIENYRRMSCGYGQATTRLKVIKNIALDEEGTTRGDIIKFYNVVFVPELRDYIMSLKSLAPLQQQQQQLSIAPVSVPDASSRPTHGSAAAAAAYPPPTTPRDRTSGHPSALAAQSMQSPLLSTLPAQLMQSPYKVQQVQDNVYLATVTTPSSQLKSTPGSSSQGGRALYAFGESPVGDLELINRAIKRQMGEKSSPKQVKKARRVLSSKA